MCLLKGARMYRFLIPVLLASPCLSLITHEPAPPAAQLTRNTPVEQYFTARLNHFDASNTDTYQMRFYYNAPFSASSSDHLLIFVGGEWSISPSWLQAGLMYELGEELNAALFYTEHRYYGLSRPTNDTSVSNLRYLSVDQALADLAQFIQYVKSDRFQGGRYSNAKVGLVGCSYAGSMATWMRHQYPHLVDAAFSDSGPLHAQEDFPEYLEVITEALRSQGGEQCVSSVESAMTSLVQLLQTTAGAQQASNLFRTCTTINNGNSLDLATFFWFGITETFAYLVQYATPGEIPAACATLTDSTVSDPLQRLANWVTSQPWTQPCIESRYSEVLARHTDLSYSAADATMRLWTYQTCVEYGWYQTTSSSQQPFLSAVPLEYFHQMCRDFFSQDINEELLRSGIERTNLFFGSRSQLADFTVSVAGGADPWSPVGPRAGDAHHLAPVYEVPTVSHCRAIRPSTDSETDELGRVKTRVKSHLGYWLTGDEAYAAAAAGAAGLRAAGGLAAAAVFALCALRA